MALPRVRLSSDGLSLVVGVGEGAKTIENDGGDEFHGHIRDIGPASATSLCHALRRVPGAHLLLSDGSYGQFDAEQSPAGPVSIGTQDRELRVEVVFDIDDWYEAGLVAEHTGRLLRPLLARHRCEFRSADMHSGIAAPPWVAWAEFAPSTRGRSVADLYAIGVEAEALLSAASSGELSRTTTLDLLRAGHIEALLGQPEGQWLDVKQMDYDLYAKDHRGKISLAQDVARFANGEEGGLIVVGFKCRKSSGGETISQVTPVPPLVHGTTSHLKAIDNRVFPPVDGLGVEEIAVEDGVLVVINIPPQAEELKPFLVTGAIVNGKVEGAFISILRRRGEASIPVTAQSIHSTLAAGRALMRRGVIAEGQSPSRSEQ